jgi:hypothetical protein
MSTTAHLRVAASASSASRKSRLSGLISYTAATVSLRRDYLFIYFQIKYEKRKHTYINITRFSLWGKPRSLHSTCYDLYTHFSLLPLSSKFFIHVRRFRVLLTWFFSKISPIWSRHVRIDLPLPALPPNL